MQIVYGLLKNWNSLSRMKDFDVQGNRVIDHKVLLDSPEGVFVALLIDCQTPLVFPINCANVRLVRSQSLNVGCNHNDLLCIKVTSADQRALSPIQRHVRKCYRKPHRPFVTPQNWKQYISRNRGIKYIRNAIHSSYSHTPLNFT